MTASVLAHEPSAEAQRHPHWGVIIRACNSQCFGSSTRLKEFLLYVADCALRQAPAEATEQHIGIHVFGRMPGYNSSEDSIVRTHARLLRQKLAEYFTHEGLAEDVIVEIPKGHYFPIFREREPTAVTVAVAAPAPAAEAPPTDPAPQASPATQPRRFASGWRVRRALLGSALALLCIAGVALPYAWWRNDAVSRLWAPFFADNDSLVIYSNAIFTGDSTSGLRYAKPEDARAGAMSPNYVDTYTGIGELAGVYDLAELFHEHHAHFLLKRSMLVTWDEARGSNLIFIGSVAENPSLRVLPPSRDFTMMTGDGFAGIVNHRPKAGEPALYARPEHPLSEDYSILALLPGMQPGKRMLIFSGLTTLGTQAAVEFACHRETAEQITGAVTGPKGEIRPFEAVLQTTLGGGVPLQTRLVSLHVH